MRLRKSALHRNASCRMFQHLLCEVQNCEHMNIRNLQPKKEDEIRISICSAQFTQLLRTDGLHHITVEWRSDGRCGADYPLKGRPGGCDPKANANKKGPCCSSIGYCGNTPNHCECNTCTDFRKIVEDTNFSAGTWIALRRIRM